MSTPSHDKGKVAASYLEGLNDLGKPAEPKRKKGAKEIQKEKVLRMMETCQSKAAYPSEAAAQRVIVRVAMKLDNTAPPLRTYQCPLCGEWHLTKQPKKQNEQKNTRTSLSRGPERQDSFLQNQWQEEATSDLRWNRTSGIPADQADEPEC